MNPMPRLTFDTPPGWQIDETLADELRARRGSARLTIFFPAPLGDDALHLLEQSLGGATVGRSETETADGFHAIRLDGELADGRTVIGVLIFILDLGASVLAVAPAVEREALGAEVETIVRGLRLDTSRSPVCLQELANVWPFFIGQSG
jgi:hypothetical protein